MQKFRFILCLYLSVLFFVNSSQGQSKIKPTVQKLDTIKQKAVAEMDSIYKANIKKTKLYGIYIPKDMDDAFAELNRLSPPESVEKLKTIDELTMAKKLRFGLGKWIAHNWNLVEGSRYSHHLKTYGLEFYDDMVDFSLISYHRYLMKKPQEYTDRAKSYKKRREDEANKKSK